MRQDDCTSQNYRHWYKTVAEGTDSFEKFHYHLQNQLQGIGLSNKSILEVGCGKGEVSLYLALFSGASNVVAVDESAGVGSPVGITKVLKNAIVSFQTHNLEVADIDIMQNGFVDESFDVIVANNALHHIVDCGLISKSHSARRGYVRLFGELRRLLAEGGVMSVREFSRNCLWRWAPIKFRWKEIDWQLHPRRDEWLSVIQEAGMVVESCRYSVPYPLRAHERLFANPIGQFLLGTNFVITARRRPYA